MFLTLAGPPAMVAPGFRNTPACNTDLASSLEESRVSAFRAMHQFKVLKTMAQTTFDLDDVKRRMQGALTSFKGDLASLRSGRASANMLDPIQVEAYGARQPLAQLATVSVPEARLLSVQVWDRSMVNAVEKAIRESDLGLNPQTEGQVLRIRIPELNEQRRKEMVKVAHKYAEESKIAVRHVRRDAIDIIKKVEKDGAFTKDDVTRQSDLVQKATDQHIAEIDQALATKEKEILSV
ncbi:ribosome recycling factor [Bosea sp. 124]|nr:ribosome recycling factor [Bosea sp. 124]